MENLKYLAFYALLFIISIVGFMGYSWLLILPSALVLSIAYIAVKGNGWRQIMGKAEMNGGIVFIAILVSQVVTAAIFFGIGRLVALFFQ